MGSNLTVRCRRTKDIGAALHTSPSASGSLRFHAVIRHGIRDYWGNRLCIDFCPHNLDRVLLPQGIPPC